MLIIHWNVIFQIYCVKIYRLWILLQPFLVPLWISLPQCITIICVSCICGLHTIFWLHCSTLPSLLRYLLPFIFGWNFNLHVKEKAINSKEIYCILPCTMGTHSVVRSKLGINAPIIILMVYNHYFPLKNMVKKVLIRHRKIWYLQEVLKYENTKSSTSNFLKELLN